MSRIIAKLIKNYSGLCTMTESIEDTGEPKPKFLRHVLSLQESSNLAVS